MERFKDTLISVLLFVIVGILYVLFMYNALVGIASR